MQFTLVTLALVVLVIGCLWLDWRWDKTHPRLQWQPRRVTYDPSVDCGYIYLTEKDTKGIVARTIPVHVAQEGIFGSLNIDIGHDGRVVGIEILGVSSIMADTDEAWWRKQRREAL